MCKCLGSALSHAKAASDKRPAERASQVQHQTRLMRKFDLVPSMHDGTTPAWCTHGAPGLRPPLHSHESIRGVQGAAVRVAHPHPHPSLVPPGVNVLPAAETPQGSCAAAA